MKFCISSWSCQVIMALCAAAAVPVAHAQCSATLGHIKPSAYVQSFPSPSLRLISSEDDHFRGEEKPIVGMWHVLFTAKTMNGSSIPDTVIDNALAVWHADKTEIMNSGRPPQDGNFCLGVWEQTSERSFRLNHFAWAGNSYAPDTPQGLVGAPIGPVHYTESVTVSRDANSFGGSFTLQQYDSSGNLAVSFTGVVSATRITIHTTAKDLM